MRIFLADPTENVIDLVAAKFSREGKGYPESYLCCLKERLILLGVGYIVVFIQIVIIPRELSMVFCDKVFLYPIHPSRFSARRHETARKWKKLVKLIFLQDKPKG